MRYGSLSPGYSEGLVLKRARISHDSSATEAKRPMVQIRMPRQDIAGTLLPSRTYTSALANQVDGWYMFRQKAGNMFVDASEAVQDEMSQQGQYCTARAMRVDLWG